MIICIIHDICIVYVLASIIQKFAAPEVGPCWIDVLEWPMSQGERRPGALGLKFAGAIRGKWCTLQTCSCGVAATCSHAYIKCRKTG